MINDKYNNLINILSKLNSTINLNDPTIETKK